MSRVLCVVFFFAAAVNLLLALLNFVPAAQRKLFWTPAEGVVAEVPGIQYMRVDFTTQTGEPCRASIRSEMVFPHGHEVGERVRLLYPQAHPEWAAEDSLRSLFGVSATHGLGTLIFGCLGWGFLRRGRWQALNASL